jgi:hypothetical protein
MASRRRRYFRRRIEEPGTTSSQTFGRKVLWNREDQKGEARQVLSKVQKNGAEENEGSAEGEQANGETLVKTIVRADPHHAGHVRVLLTRPRKDTPDRNGTPSRTPLLKYGVETAKLDTGVSCGEPPPHFDAPLIPLLLPGFDFVPQFLGAPDAAAQALPA